MATQDGTAFKTYGYVENDDPNDFPQPGLELTDTGDRTEISIHPGQGIPVQRRLHKPMYKSAERERADRLCRQSAASACHHRGHENVSWR